MDNLPIATGKGRNEDIIIAMIMIITIMQMEIFMYVTTI